MKNYSRFLSILVLCFLLPAATHAQVRVTGGPEIGFTATGFMETHTEDLVVGLHVHGGATVHVQIGGYFAVRPSVLVQSGKLEDPDYPKQYTKLTRISILCHCCFQKTLETTTNFILVRVLT